MTTPDPFAALRARATGRASFPPPPSVPPPVPPRRPRPPRPPSRPGGSPSWWRKLWSRSAPASPPASPPGGGAAKLKRLGSGWSWAVAMLAAVLLFILARLVSGLLTPLEPQGHFASQPAWYMLPEAVLWLQILLGVLILAAFVIDFIRRFVRRLRSGVPWYRLPASKEVWLELGGMVVVFLLCLAPVAPGLRWLPLMEWAVRLLGVLLILWYAWWRGVQSSAKHKTTSANAYEPARTVGLGVGLLGVLCLVLFFGPGWAWPHGQAVDTGHEAPAVIQVDPDAACAGTVEGNPEACAGIDLQAANGFYSAYLDAHKACEEKKSYGQELQRAAADYNRCQKELYGDEAAPFGQDVSSEKAVQAACQEQGFKKACWQTQVRTLCQRRASLVNKLCDGNLKAFYESAYNQIYTPR